MRKLIAVGISIALSAAAAAQTPSTVVDVGPAMTVPVGDWSSSVVSTGGGGQAGVEYGFGGNVEPFLRLDLQYAFNPLAAGTTLSTASVHAGGGVRFRVLPRFAVEGFAAGGYYYGSLADGSATGGLATVRSGVGMSYMLTSLLDLGIRLGYRADLGVAHLVEAWIGTSIHLSGREDRQRAIDLGQSTDGILPPPPGRGLRIQDLAIDELFPVFHIYYDTNPVGTLELENLGDNPVTDPKLSFLVPQFMEAPREIRLPESVQPGERLPIDLTALFTDQILSVTEATKVTGELSLEYTIAGQRYGETTAVSVRLLDRNATIWDDDRRAAAFVTSKDPAILTLSKNAAGIVRDLGPGVVDRNLAAAIGLFSALDVAGVNYVIDPQTPFVEYSQSETAIDYLQFPRQTLEYRAGDCDDLSVLYAAMLESAGIETAFVTIPGHIYVAFRSALPSSQLIAQLGSSRDVIIDGENAWIPVEVTLRRTGFMDAWSTGARQWREAFAAGTEALIPVRSAWEIYEPVALPGSSVPIAVAPDAILESFNREITLLADRQMVPQVRAIEDQIQARGESPALLNRLGVLYARYDRMEQAVALFEQATQGRDYRPALANLGNTYALRQDWTAALGYYQRAAGLRSPDTAVLLGLAKAYYHLERFGEARETHAQLASLDPALGEQFAYLGGNVDSAARATAINETARIVIWSEEEE